MLNKTALSKCPYSYYLQCELPLKVIHIRMNMNDLSWLFFFACIHTAATSSSFCGKEPRQGSVVHYDFRWVALQKASSSTSPRSNQETARGVCAQWHQIRFKGPSTHQVGLYVLWQFSFSGIIPEIQSLLVLFHILVATIIWLRCSDVILHSFSDFALTYECMWF